MSNLNTTNDEQNSNTKQCKNCKLYLDLSCFTSSKAVCKSCRAKSERDKTQKGKEQLTVNLEKLIVDDQTSPCETNNTLQPESSTMCKLTCVPCKVSNHLSQSESAFRAYQSILPLCKHELLNAITPFDTSVSKDIYNIKMYYNIRLLELYSKNKRCNLKEFNTRLNELKNEKPVIYIPATNNDKLIFISKFVEIHDRIRKLELEDEKKKVEIISNKHEENVDDVLSFILEAGRKDLEKLEEQIDNPLDSAYNELELYLSFYKEHDFSNSILNNQKLDLGLNSLIPVLEKIVIKTKDRPTLLHKKKWKEFIQQYQKPIPREKSGYAKMYKKPNGNLSCSYHTPIADIVYILLELYKLNFTSAMVIELAKQSGYTLKQSKNWYNNEIKIDVIKDFYLADLYNQMCLRRVENQEDINKKEKQHMKSNTIKNAREADVVEIQSSDLEDTEA